MRSSLMSRLRGPLLSAAAAALVLTTTTALAGSGVGATVNLGEINTVDARTVWEGNAGADVELRLENSGTAPALSLVTPAGVPPFKVSSSSRVGGLNADLLDGFDSTRFWKLGGNPGGNFLGTTDNKPLELKVNGERALRIEPNATSPNLIGGYSANAVQAGAVGATISGGGFVGFTNRVRDGFGTVGGGGGNLAGDDDSEPMSTPYATVAGGTSNKASGALSTVAGGGSNKASFTASTVGGGFGNMASGDDSTVAGGGGNTASGVSSAVAGGQGNTASAFGAAVAGGFSNTASGQFSLAVGNRAKANHDGTFVWGDSQNTDMNTSGADQFIARAQGHFFLQSDSTLDNQNGFINTSTGAFLSTGGTWTNASSRNLKAGFTPVNPESILSKVAALPLTSWHYRAEPGVRHIGPVSEDFHRAFGVGDNSRSIGTIDEGGVALAAIQGLYRQNKALQRENKARQRENKTLHRDNRTLRAQLGAQNARLTKLEQAFSKLSR